MIKWLKIKNLALIVDADIEFSKGFNIITGETGAGKSIIMSSIGLLLGERAGKQIIRNGTNRCEISAGIKLPEHLLNTISPILENAGILLEEGNMLYLKRIISVESSRNFINDTPVTLQTLKNIGELLIDIHAANEHQSLLKPSVQMKMLDKFGHTESLVNKCAVLYESIENIRNRRSELLKNIPSPVEAEHLKAILNEISAVNPRPDEETALNEKYNIAASARDIKQTLSKIIFLANESENSVTDIFGEIYRELENIAAIDTKKGSQLLNQCSELSELTREFITDIEQYADTVDIDEQELSELEIRLNSIQTLKRKYGYTIEDVLKTAEGCRNRLRQYEEREDILQELAEEEEKLIGELDKYAEKLSIERKKAAKKFEKQVMSALSELGFIKSEFFVNIELLKTVGPSGKDKIDFLFAPNPGERKKSLKETASSGEISRVMLAIKTVLADADTLPVLIFDEVDVNIGGKTAIKVAAALKELSATHQLICISHLPTVAAKADTHFRVDKNVKDNSTESRIEKLSPNKRIDEIARMLGSGKTAKEHAKKLCARTPPGPQI